MFVVVTLPYSPFSERDVDFFGKVVRIELLANGLTGIAIELVALVGINDRNGMGQSEVPLSAIDPYRRRL